MTVEFISKYETVTLELTKEQLINTVREKFSRHISVLSFRIELNEGQKEWNGYDYGINQTIRIK